jgi:beta-1,4-mannosyltransferase
LAVGVKNFIIEIATETPLDIPKNQMIREIVVPKDYQTKSGAMFKARVLQYCLEDHINELTSNDWIVHLDEETIFTENCVRGIINFIIDGRNQFGQGLITYINGKVVNWYTSLADSLRTVVITAGLQFMLRAIGKPLIGLTGSFLVAQVRKNTRNWSKF